MCHSYLLDKGGAGKFPTMPRTVFEEFVADLRELGTTRVVICGGGEPLLHPDAFAMLELVKSSGMSCRLVTNGSLLTPEMAEAFVEMGLDAINVSLDSVSDETHHEIHRAPLGQRSKIVDVLRHILRYRRQRGANIPMVSISFVVQKRNYHEIVPLAQEVVDLGLDHVALAPLLGVVEYAHLRGLALEPQEQEEARRYAEEAGRILRSAGTASTVNTYLNRPLESLWTKKTFTEIPCHIGQLYCAVDSGGNVVPCCGCGHRVIGNVTERRFKEIWNSPAYRAFRREGLDLPRRGRPLDLCRCYACGQAPIIVEYHRRLYAAADQA
jgi:radical SAM protein with 4Fe4S-binding SPASM domain